MIDRYIYAVTKELPKKVKDEIASELETLIEDMIDGQDNSLSKEEKINQVLTELGNPKELANRYRGRERYLIGPDYYDKYLFVMKIVILSVFIGISVASGFGVVFSDVSTTEMIGGYIGTLFSAVLQGAAWVTGVFAILEYNNISVETGMEVKVWEPAQLPELPNKKARISRGESAFTIMLSTIMLSLFFFLPELIGIYFQADGAWGFIPFFNIQELASLLF